MESKIFSSALSKNKDWRKALEEITAKAKKELAGKSCDLALFFVSEGFKDFDNDAFVGSLKELLSARTVLGCNSCGVIGNEKEVEMEPALSLLAMHLPDVKVQPFQLSANDVLYTVDGAGLIDFLDVYPTDNPRFLCLAEPNSCDVTKLLGLFNDGYKGLPIIGGLASGIMVDVPNWLCLNGALVTEGAVGVALIGPIEFDILVSQGCRPIDKPYVVTKAEENVLYELAGRPTLTILKEILESLPARDRKLAEHSLFIGLAMDEKKESFHRGDFLVRNLLGFDPETGALVVGSTLKVGQTAQFQLRDSETSSEDLSLLLEKLKTPNGVHPQGGLLVSCCGRGKGLYGEADHDARAIQSAKGPLPLSGFFANGEIGPVGKKNYVHGYTSSLVILR